jgi:hypothetical protein
LNALLSFPDTRTIDYLNGKDVAYILLHARNMPDAQYRALIGQLATDARLELAARFLEDGHEIAAYKLSMPQGKSPSRIVDERCFARR